MRAAGRDGHHTERRMHIHVVCTTTELAIVLSSIDLYPLSYTALLANIYLSSTFMMSNILQLSIYLNTAPIMRCLYLGSSS